MRPAPIDALRKLYQTVVADTEKLSESHFFRAFHNFLREEMLPRDEALKATADFQSLIKAHIRKEKKKIGYERLNQSHHFCLYTIRFPRREKTSLCPSVWTAGENVVFFSVDFCDGI